VGIQGRGDDGEVIWCFEIRNCTGTNASWVPNGTAQTASVEGIALERRGRPNCGSTGLPAGN